MAKFDDGQNFVTVFGETLYNDIVRAFRNAITDSGQTIDATNIQLSKALANYAQVSSFYTENGIADAYNLIPTNNFKGLTALTNGAEVRFRAANANTGACTVNVNGLGSLPIKRADGVTNPAAGEIGTNLDTRLRYDLANNVWTLQTINLVSTGLLNTNGYIKIPANIGGIVEIIIQWGFKLGLGAFSFPINFPNAVFSIAVARRDNDGNESLGVSALSTTGATFQSIENMSGNYIAVGF
jgi:hypothetical protein